MSQWAPPDAGSVIPPAPVVHVDPNAMVAVTNVTKAFGDVVAVSDVSFSVGPGVTALLGPNGAGKSTLFRMMCGLTPPSQGTVRVLGADARRDREVRGRIGLAPQQDALFDRLTAHRFVELAAETHAVPDPTPRPAGPRRTSSSTRPRPSRSAPTRRACGSG
jgi:ABC-2 type transport system ATP-binding protein